MRTKIIFLVLYVAGDAVFKAGDNDGMREAGREDLG